MRRPLATLTLLALAAGGCRATLPRLLGRPMPGPGASLSAVEQFQQHQAQIDAYKVYEQYEPRVAAAPR
ncbi:hypothetical protein Pla123a_26930 [Posidoniimonas polymericola]|uniref:Uncharacterized protein n=1 Tax=Posidoniimonas polymericola TaxID=2528002 RepID=A0A5C5YM61_9BACT|nr:hypothetical protein [Posidoniimonas polymericola]TWT75909.1 hypothetical protein Pla123a_26930 [Posidoniimonas polymericola]